MAKIKLAQLRELDASYHIYRQPSEIGEMTIVRRKVAMPSDVQHRSSKPTQRQRQRFGTASKRWSNLPNVVKADLRDKYGFVLAQTPHGKSEVKLLQGARLYQSQDIHLQKYHDTHATTELYFCALAVNPKHLPIQTPLYLFCYQATMGETHQTYQLSPGNYLFYPVRDWPKGYIVRGLYYPSHPATPLPFSKQQLLRGQDVALHPGWWCWEGPPGARYTYSDAPNWGYSPLAGGKTLWTVRLYARMQWHPTILYATPEVSLTWHKLSDHVDKIQLHLINPHKLTRYCDTLACLDNIFWTVDLDWLGHPRVDPPHTTVVYNHHQLRILRYED